MPLPALAVAEIIQGGLLLVQILSDLQRGGVSMTPEQRQAITDQRRLLDSAWESMGPRVKAKASKKSGGAE